MTDEFPRGVNVYLSEWGTFTMPEGLAERTKWRYIKTNFLQGRLIVKEPEPISDNHEFFSWLHQQEVAAGKPVAPKQPKCSSCGEPERKNHCGAFGCPYGIE